MLHPDDGLWHEALLPLAWQVLPALPDAEAVRREAEAAREVLRALLVLALGPGEPVDDGAGPAPGERGGELTRLERKLDLALDLLGRLLARSLDLPAMHAVRLSPQSLIWQSDEIPAAGPVAVELYLDARYPLPLCLSGNAHGAAGEIRVDFGAADPPLRDALERLIFLYHRRRLGRERRPAAR